MSIGSEDGAPTPDDISGSIEFVIDRAVASFEQRLVDRHKPDRGDASSETIWRLSEAITRVKPSAKNPRREALTKRSSIPPHRFRTVAAFEA